MNKSRLAVIACCFVIVYSLCSCKKSSSTPTAHVITYKLTSSDFTPFSSVSYTNVLGVQTVVSATDSTSGWSKTISESYTGFTVILQVQGQNSSTSELRYTLEIIADGTSRAKQQITTAAFASFNTQVSAVIQ